jgi:16S rRNA (guanine527-N7)-methyltransferase
MSNTILDQFIVENEHFFGEKRETIHKKLATYQQAIIDGNEKINLISHNDIENIEIRHFLDSLIPTKFLPKILEREKPLKIIDIGSGAGFPGLPIKIVFPDSSITFVDSVGKKCRFIKEAAEIIGLAGVTVLNERAEILGQSHVHRQIYEIAISRAVAQPAVALELCVPLVNLGGHTIHWAGGKEWDDKKRLERVCRQLGARIVLEQPYRLPGDPEERTRKIFVTEKIASTERTYPRKVGIPDKRPLI